MKSSSLPSDAPAPLRRKSNGLKHFVSTLPSERRLQALELGRISEANVNFLAERGCKIHSVDLLASFDRAKRELGLESIEAEHAERFVGEYLNFRIGQFDAILVWDALEHLDGELLAATMARLTRILRPGGGLLAFFHSQTRGEMVEVYDYRIMDGETLTLSRRDWRRLPHTFNNRNLERLFADFHSVKFFLTRDHLREVIAVR